jgi:hypothetical protein
VLASLYLRTPVLFQVGTAFVTPTDGQLYEPTDGAVTVPMGDPDRPKFGVVNDCCNPGPSNWVVEMYLMCLCFLACAAKGVTANPTATSVAIASLVVIMIDPLLS